MVECQLPKLDVEGSNPFARLSDKCWKMAGLNTRPFAFLGPQDAVFWASGSLLGHSVTKSGPTNESITRRARAICSGGIFT
jgi:hypothetical protein